MRDRFNGRMMAQARKAAGMNQADLAAVVRRNRVSISDIERGEFQPSRALAEQIALSLGVELESLYVPAAGRPGSATAPPSLTIEELQVIDAMRRCGEVERGKIWAFAQGMAAGGGAEGAAAAAELEEAIARASRAEKAQDEPRSGTA